MRASDAVFDVVFEMGVVHDVQTAVDDVVSGRLYMSELRRRTEGSEVVLRSWLSRPLRSLACRAWSAAAWPTPSTTGSSPTLPPCRHPHAIRVRRARAGTSPGSPQDGPCVPGTDRRYR